MSGHADIPAAEELVYVPASIKNLSDIAYEKISQMIRRRQMRGGETIVEARLAALLKISRTPLREALQRLEGEGLVVKGTGRSFMVRSVSLSEYLQSLKVREILEVEAGALAVGHIPQERLDAVRREIEELRAATTHHTEAHWHSDDSLHGLYIDGCRNEVLGRAIQALRVTTRLFEIARLADRVEADSVEHLRILEALSAGDPKAARVAVAQHTRSLHKFALETLG